ncbi:hypothetical protein Ahy_A07g031417 isoform D [Arachis hypogaea]|uniref:Uncharacterized protein n=1 Tax=Arachis hypogaea TaxID=3818 RepID=A0A445C3U5_ARAHY|nr:hypothetical protein Ahy_A07g031417 isoform D [Arachis hypogaea]
MKPCLSLSLHFTSLHFSLPLTQSRTLKFESLPFSNPSPSSRHCSRPSVARIPSLFVLFSKSPTPALSFRELGPSVVFICSPSSVAATHSAENPKFRSLINFHEFFIPWEKED